MTYTVLGEEYVMVLTYFFQALNDLFELLASVRDTRCVSDERGVTAIEYALLGSLIAIAIVGGVYTLGGSLGDLYDNLASRVTAAMS